MKKMSRWDLHTRKFELIVPIFFGCLGSLVICASVMMRQPHYVRGDVMENQGLSYEVVEKDAAVTGNAHFFTRTEPERLDFILELYRDPQAQARVTAFFTEICASSEIAEIILSNANSFDIPPALAVALAWEESRLNPRAVNTKNRDQSIDRGLFQLNNRSFPRLELQAFFNPQVNAQFGMSHLRNCLDMGGSEIAALAMYNAGASRVKSSGTPKTTLDYISRILENRREIENRFREREAIFQEQAADDFSDIAEEKSERPRLVPLMPLARK
jgi:hypothetical protein